MDQTTFKGQELAQEETKLKDTEVISSAGNEDLEELSPDEWRRRSSNKVMAFIRTIFDER